MIGNAQVFVIGLCHRLSLSFRTSFLKLRIVLTICQERFVRPPGRGSMLRERP